ncbi:putative vacuolar protein sorting-associated protein TDA6 [Purpureocillium lavendulum]|uniref:Vacuolar protein sorting-associated protein TDA6 n=1 Tax=Purpureocillium lavendulum TaxID=1247861 RepID=A0AB34FN39_9HYPO|nr:putative vacuolar protein sorting-associated protein TDA6 [Purpureocillium lavendulum]
MAAPLTPASETHLNRSTAPTTTATTRYDDYEIVKTYSEQSTKMAAEDSTQNSSPFVSSVGEVHATDQENVSPTKGPDAQRSRIISGTELSPLKILSSSDQKRSSSPSSGSESEKRQRRSSSPRKMSPDKRFPVRVSGTEETPRPGRTHERTISLEDAVMQNEGLRHAIEIFEDEQSALDDDGDAVATGCAPEDETAAPDDTMVSTFSTFSAVPNMTMFAKLGQSPTKVSGLGGVTPRARRDLSAARQARQASHDDSGNTTNLLMDFTEQMRFPQRSPAKRGNPSPSRRGHNITSTPSRPLSNLIDFDIPPMPTPRSVPSITPRELESLKSGFLSEISSLKASLSGKEAEVLSLKAAVGDAEKRVGESMEQLREERAMKEHLTAEKEDWENRGREMESVLCKVREEIVHGQREREELEQKLDESEKRREAAEMLHQEAESKMAGMRAGKESEKNPSSPEKAMSPTSNKEVEIAVERVARELHALYKSKHETKVAALKKSYESRWEKKVRELESRLEELSDDNDRLRVGRDATMTKVEASEVEERKAQAVRDSAAIKELNADVQRLEAVVDTVKRDNEDLRGMLEKERVEKGELVQLAEEMMSMQSFVAQPRQPQQQPQQQQQQQQHQQQQVPVQYAAQPQTQRLPEQAKTPRASVGRGSGLRAPGTGLRAPHERTKSGGGGGGGSAIGGLPRPGGGVPRSGIMSSIEKMGNYRGRGE